MLSRPYLATSLMLHSSALNPPLTTPKQKSCNCPHPPLPPPLPLVPSSSLLSLYGLIPPCGAEPRPYWPAAGRPSHAINGGDGGRVVVVRGGGYSNPPPPHPGRRSGVSRTSDIAGSPKIYTGSGHSADTFCCTTTNSRGQPACLSPIKIPTMPQICSTCLLAHQIYPKYRKFLSCC